MLLWGWRAGVERVKRGGEDSLQLRSHSATVERCTWVHGRGRSDWEDFSGVGSCCWKMKTNKRHPKASQYTSVVRIFGWNYVLSLGVCGDMPTWTRGTTTVRCQIMWVRMFSVALSGVEDDEILSMHLESQIGWFSAPLYDFNGKALLEHAPQEISQMNWRWMDVFYFFSFGFLCRAGFPIVRLTLVKHESK